MARSKTKLVYGKDNDAFTFFLEHGDLAPLTKVDRSLYQEAVDRFASLMRKNIEERDDYDRSEGNANAGIMHTLDVLRNIQ